MSDRPTLVSAIADLSKARKAKEKAITWKEAMEDFIANASEEQLAMEIRNIVVVSYHNATDYSYGLLSSDNVPEIVGTLDCIKFHILNSVYGDDDYDD